MTVTDYLAYFFIYSILGWVLEVVFVTVDTGRPTNRGFLAGCYCPIYGVGAVAILLATRPFGTNMVADFVVSAVMGSLIELVTGWTLEKLFKRRWWDYSDRPFNIGGYICLQFSLGWGLIGLLFLRVLHPVVETFVDWVPQPVLVGAVAVLTVAILVDTAATIAGVLGFNKRLRALQHASDLMHEQSDALSHRIGSDALEASHAAHEVWTRLDDDAQRARARRERLRGQLNATTRRQLRAFPRMRSVQDSRTFDALRSDASAGHPASQPRRTP